jgi:hypothetical protein
MKDARVVLIASAVAPKTIVSIFIQTTSYTRALAPEKKKSIRIIGSRKRVPVIFWRLIERQLINLDIGIIKHSRNFNTMSLS